jgi:RNA polymerase sigma-70 factor (ECF subfamily)
MERLKKGDMSALEVIYDRYRGMVEAAVRRIVPRITSADLDELLQDTFIALIKSAAVFDRAKRLKPWLYGIAVNKAVGSKRKLWIRRNLLGKHILETEALGMHVVESHSARVELRGDLIRAFSALPREQHDVMFLHVVEGFSGEEIADILGIKVNTVWTRLHRARKALSVAMKADRKGAYGK